MDGDNSPRKMTLDQLAVLREIESKVEERFSKNWPGLDALGNLIDTLDAILPKDE